MSDLGKYDVATLPGLTAVAPTLYALLGVPSPERCGEAPLEEIVKVIESWPTGGERCLVFAADAIGVEQINRYPDIIAPVMRQAPQSVTLRALLPTMTPVNYASMFSGATPEVHGIKSYEKPVLKVETIFDVLPAAGKRVAIVAVLNSSIDRIFRERPVAYYSEPDDAAVLAKTLELLAGDSYDCLVVYQSAYDDALHRSTPWSETAVGAMKQIVANFTQLGAAIDQAWGRYHRILHFAPDHGAHTNEEGKGTHGSDLPEDVIVRHFFGLRPPRLDPRGRFLQARR